MIKDTILKYSKIIVIMFIVFVGLKAIAYVIPNNSIRENINASLNQIELEGTYPRILYNTDTVFFGQQMDNYTDSIYLNEAYSFGEYSLIERIAGDYRANNPNATNELEQLTFSIRDGGNAAPYARQWFGCISVLRILLVFFTYPEIRILSQMFFILLLFIVSNLLWKKINIVVSIAFFTSILFGNLAVIPACINIANSFYVVLFATLMVLYLYPKKCDAAMYMFITGGLTCYFDLFVTPLLSYVFLMGIILTIDYKNKPDESFIKYLNTTIQGSIGWLAGYIILWMTKWGLATVVLKQNLFMDAVNEILKMSSQRTVSWAPTTKLGLIKASLLNNISNMFPNNILFVLKSRFGTPMLLVLILLLIIVIAFLLKKTKTKTNTNKSILFMLLIVSTAPYVWYTVIHTHSFVHFWMTYRLQCGTVFLLILAFGYGTNLLSMIQQKKMVK